MLADCSKSDEADVFLESRSSNTANLDRNALVSSKKSHAKCVLLAPLIDECSSSSRFGILRRNFDPYHKSTQNLRHSSAVASKFRHKIQRS